MTLSLKYADRIFEILKSLSQKADYWDVRFGHGEGTHITYRSKVLEELSFPKSYGGSIRVLVNDGWGFVTFNELSELSKASEAAYAYAKLVSKGKTSWPPVPVIKETVTAPDKKKDFLKKSTTEKVKLLDFFRDCLWEKKTNLVQTNLGYSDSLAHKLFVSSEGSVIDQEVPRLRVIVTATASKNGLVQSFHDNLTFTTFKNLTGRQKEVRNLVKIVNNLVDAPPAVGGEFPVILEGTLAGTFAHEAFGHLSEADNVEKDEKLQKIMVLGKRFGNNLITIFENPQGGHWGYYKYDDEGVLATKSPLLDKGILVGRLHSRSTAAALGEKPNGHARAASVKDNPIVRMGSTCIAPGKSTLVNLFSGIKKGYYAVSWRAGMTDHENYTFAAGYGYEIINGKLGKMVRDLKLSGNLFQTLKDVEGVGKDLIEDPGMCGKLGQSVPTGEIAPALRLAKILVMGVNQ